MSGFFGIGAKKRTNVTLTELGKQKSEQSVGQGARLTILSDLSENGASSVRAISERTGMNEQRVKEIVRGMRAEGWVKDISAEGD